MNRFIRLAGIILGSSSIFCTSKQFKQFNFIDSRQQRANNPIQDRITYCKIQVKGIKGYMVSVFDGHGGNLVADFASKNIAQYLHHRLSQNKSLPLTNKQYYQKSLTQTYKDIEQSFFTIFKQNIRQAQYQRVGSCALTAIILKDRIYVANAGDCQGIILGKNYIKTNKRLNAAQPQQQQRLKRLFPDEDDIYKCKYEDCCYVKGRLQPTRSLGDYYLKDPQYNFTKLKVFTGPYISYQPLITNFQTKNDHQYLLLATDGLWDQLSHQQLHTIYLENKNKKLIDCVFQQAKNRILKRNFIKYQNLQKLTNRRNLHDDISIITVNLKQLIKQL